MLKGNIFDIQRYSIHDGPGIRTVVFLKGCPLRCKWCSNPESWKTEPQLFYASSRCIGCLTCVKNCPNKEITAKEGKLQIHWERLEHNQLGWAETCPAKALSIKGKWMGTDEVYAEVAKDMAFYKRSGGGVTLSGGEPLLQAEFAAELLHMCREHGVHTAVETTGCVPLESIQKVMGVTDLFLYDLKSADNKVHERWTRTGNDRILENLRWLSGKGADIFVRTPIIPGVNDRERDILEIIEILQEDEISNYDILPFHQYGSGKYLSCGIKYAMQDIKPPEDSCVEKIKDIIQSFHLCSNMERRKT